MIVSAEIRSRRSLLSSFVYACVLSSIFNEFVCVRRVTGKKLMHGFPLSFAEMAEKPLQILRVDKALLRGTIVNTW